MRLQSRKKSVDAVEESIVDDTLVFVGCDLVLALLALLVNLVLLCADEGTLVNVWMNFDVGVVAELESVLESCQPCARGRGVRSEL